MSGGNWNQGDLPVLPGLYMNFKAAAQAGIAIGARGVVAVPVKAHWGPVNEFVSIGTENELIDFFTASVANGASAYWAVRLALLGGAQKVLAYRLADSPAAAAITLEDTTAEPVNALKLEAKYPGARGNAFKVTVAENLADDTKTDIKLYEGTTLLRTFTFPTGTVAAAVAAINDDDGNKWVTATKLADGNGTLTSTASSPFVGGDSGISGLTNADYIAALAAFETQEFHVLALDGVTDSGLHTSIVSWISRIRGEGKGVMAVLGGSGSDDTAADAVNKATTRSSGYNHEGVVNVGTGAKLDGVIYSSAQVSAYVAGLIAGTALSSSTTYAGTPFDDVTRRWTRSEQELAVKGGVFLLVHDGRRVKVLRGINSLVTPTASQNYAWKKIRTIRVMDTINADLQRTAEDSYIGKVNNTQEGRLTLISACEQYLQTLAQAGVVDQAGLSVSIDPDFDPEPDQVFLKWEARLTDVMEQIFGTFIVQ